MREWLLRRGRRRGSAAALAMLLVAACIVTVAVWPRTSGAVATSFPAGASDGLTSPEIVTGSFQVTVGPDGTIVAVATPTGASGSAKPSGSAPSAGAIPTAGDTAKANPASTATATRGATPSPATPRPTATATPAHPASTPTPSPRATVRPTPAPTPPPVGSCPVFPASNVWNADISRLPAARNSAALIAAIGVSKGLHPDFSASGYGIPYNVVGASTAKASVSFDYADESDPGPYPIPASPRIEGGSDSHLLLADTSTCRLYELFAAHKTSSGWTAGSGAIWNLRSNALRPAGWTSADAAGLPIYPGLVRYDEVARGAIRHALRFTAPRTCAGYIYPARHQAGSGSCSTYPAMGLRVRLKASVDISKFGPQSRVVLQTLKRYGMILADNGSSWYVTGAPDSRWNDDELHGLGGIKGSDFEVVDTSGLVNG